MFNVQSGSSIQAVGDITLGEMTGSVVTMTVDGAASSIHSESLNVGGTDGIPGGTATLNLTNQSRAIVTGKVTTWAGGTIHPTTGSLTIGDSSPVAGDGSFRINAGGALSGSGVLQGGVVNAAGEIIPGSIFSPGTLTIQGAFTQNLGGTLNIRLAGTNTDGYDHLNISGNAALGGTLAVSLINGFTPIAGNSFEIIAATGGITGMFDNLVLPALTGRPLVWDTSHLYTTGTLSVVTSYLQGDWNRDGQVTTADVSAMLGALTDLSSYKTTYSLSSAQLAAIADLDGDGAVTNRDIQGLLNLVANPSGSGAVQAVPEPSALAMILLGIAAAARPMRFARRNPA